MSQDDREIRLPSRATLIICPSNLVNQWKAEVIKCLPADCKCIVISKIVDHRMVSWNDIMDADIVIVPITFLMNQNYHNLLAAHYNIPMGHRKHTRWENYFADTMRPIIQMKTASYFEAKGKVNLECFYYHRIVFDEFHELNATHSTTQAIVSGLKSNYAWGLTGTPCFSSNQGLNGASKFLQVTKSMNGTPAYIAFKEIFIRRNNEDMNLPPLINSVEWLDLTRNEMVLYQSRLPISKIEAFMMCSHYQIADCVVNAVGEGVRSRVMQILTIAQVSAGFLVALMDESKKLGTHLAKKVETLEGFARQLDKAKTSERPALLKRIEAESLRQSEIYEKLESKKREYSHLKMMMDSLAEKKLDDWCAICLDEMRDMETLIVTKCGHLFCKTCFNDLTLAHAEDLKCPICVAPIKEGEAKEVFNDAPPPEVEKVDEEIDPVALEEERKWGKYGSKILSMMRKMEQVVEENPNAKIIIFIQFKRLANLIQTTLAHLNIAHARVHGTCAARLSAVNRFKNDMSVRVILLSTEGIFLVKVDSVSGLHLPETTHIFVVHPFWFGDHRQKEADAAEKQGKI